ncbi:MAG: BMP family ABC transporter substrate-binding protein [Oscillospiraceae bacterium]|jgi:basic membrane lipoprotein Med (substrate-binding protein (PBP1-ABC) superfamily)|nr:BMP family ABC transporter substrate-binding protein [Oscillospiraceae bacterium]
MDESKNAYIAARKLGRKYVTERGETNGYLPALDHMLKGVAIVGEISLGFHEIPLSAIAGTKTAGRSNAFAGNFAPLLESDTEFASKWRRVYEWQYTEGIREPITCYQYMNKFYVQEGNKRVSVLNAVGAVSIPARITRLIPERDESSNDISVYYEMLDYDKRVFFGDLWFSKRGNFTKLIAAAEEYLSRYSDVSSDAPTIIMGAYAKFKAAYRTVDAGDINLTVGDALTEYCGVFGFAYNVPIDDLLRNLSSFKGQLLFAAGTVERSITEITTHTDTEGTHTGFFSRAAKRVTIAVAYESTPERDLWTEGHDRALRRLERKYGEQLNLIRIKNVPGVGKLAWQTLKAAAAAKPKLLLTASPMLSNVSLRYALEYPETVVLNCDVPRDGRNINTYFYKMYDLTFLCGILAAASSEVGVVGYMSSAPTWNYAPTYDLNAYALGARLINPRARILDYTMSEVNDWNEHIEARREFAAHGADVAFCRHSPDNPLDRKAFPEVYAQIYKIAANGAPLESLAAATLDWGPFYDKMINDALLGRIGLTGGVGGVPVHYGWGFQTGVMDIFPVYGAIGVAGRLLNIFRDIMKIGSIHPFEGPVTDVNGNLRIDWGEVPTLMEIQEMDWLVYSIEKIR